MTRPLCAPAPLFAAVLLALAGASVQAESLASSASSATSASLGSLSDSIGRSSDSSSPRQVADGDWRILEIARRDDRPGAVQLRLQPLAEAQGREPLLLTLPREAVEAAGLQVGQTVTSRAQAWGLQFARADRAEPFYLVVADERHRTLTPQPVL